MERERNAAAVATVDEVDDLLCLALYAAGRAMTGRYRALLEPLGLTYPQYLVLLVLDETGGSTVGELGTRLRLESSTLSPLAKRLEAQGLITRRRSTADERTVVLALTEAGRTRCAQTGHVPAEISRATGLTDAQQFDLVLELRRLEGNLTDAQHG